LGLLALKLTLTPGVIAGATLAARRFGLVGLFALMAFATTLAVVLTHLPLADSYLLAIALTLTIQLASLRAIRS
jgi:hypothetical protein